MNFTALEYHSGVVRRYYVGAADMIAEGMSKTAAHRLLSQCPSRVRVKVQGRRSYLAIPAATYAVLLQTRQGRGNPRMHDTEFQSQMARRRWFKDSP